MLDKFEKATNAIEVCNLAYNFPSYKNELFQLLVQPANFQRLVTCAVEISHLAFIFDNNKEELFQLVVQPANFQRLVTNSRQLSTLVRAFPHKEILKKSSIKEILTEITGIKANSPEQKAYTRGAAMGFFETLLPPEVANHIGSFLDRKSGAQLALTTKKAADTARSEHDEKLPKPALMNFKP